MVDPNRYGALFYELAGQFDEIVVVAMGEVFADDEVAGDTDMMPVEKLHDAKIEVAKTIFNAWLQMQEGKTS